MTIAPDLRQVAQELVDQFSWAALDDRQRIMEWLGDRGLLSPLDDPDLRVDRDAADAVQSHARWLLT